MISKDARGTEEQGTADRVTVNRSSFNNLFAAVYETLVALDSVRLDSTEDREQVENIIRNIRFRLERVCSIAGEGALKGIPECHLVGQQPRPLRTAETIADSVLPTVLEYVKALRIDPMIESAVTLLASMGIDRPTVERAVMGRAETGAVKYGGYLVPFCGRSSAVDAAQELLDFIAYRVQWLTEGEMLMREMAKREAEQ